MERFFGMGEHDAIISIAPLSSRRMLSSSRFAQNLSICSGVIPMPVSKQSSQSSSRGFSILNPPTCKIPRIHGLLQTSTVGVPIKGRSIPSGPRLVNTCRNSQSATDGNGGSVC